MFKTILLFLFFPFFCFAQQFPIKGIVIDSKSKIPLPFVSISIKNTLKGTYSDNEGRFSISKNSSSDTLVFSFVGYEKKQIFQFNSSQNSIVELVEKENSLNEVIVRPTENPAWKIIRKVLNNRDLNDPEKYKTFSANAYTKTIFSGDSLKSVKKDSVTKQKTTTRQSINFYIVENYSELISKHPNKFKETIVASVNNFLQLYNQFYNSIPTDIHTMTFYRELYNFVPLKRFYINPINDKTFSQYDFDLKDTVFNEKDSTFRLTFKPLPKTNFDGLTGILHINSDGFAIENINLMPSDTLQNFVFQIQQQYERVGGKWFPKRTMTKLTTKQKTDKISGTFNIKFSTIYSNIKINQPIDNKLFNESQKVVLPSASKHTNQTFEVFRSDTLTTAEKKMYKSFDKMSAVKALKKVDSSYGHLITGLMVGVLEFGKIEILPAEIIGKNVTEGIRTRIGIQNNQRLQPRFRIYGNFGYGLLDKQLKYSVLGSWHITKDRYFRLSTYYINDLILPAKDLFLQPNFLVERNLNFIPGTVIDSVIVKVDYYKKLGTSLHFKPLRFNWMRIELNHEIRKPNYVYKFENRNQFENTELVFDWRFAYKESIYRIGRGESIVNRYFPIINLRISKGLKEFGGEFDYWKFSFQSFYQIRFKKFGITDLKFDAGYINGNLPYSYLFGSIGSLGVFRIRGNDLTLRTLPLDGFLADKYTTLYLSHDFNRNIFRLKSKYSQPRLKIFHNILVGDLSNTENHFFSWKYQTTKIHTEAGLEIHDLLRVPIKGIYLSTGVGFAYKYGIGSAADWRDNFRVYSLGLNVSR